MTESMISTQKPTFRLCTGACLIAIATFALVGCGKSDSTDAVVNPPSPSQVESPDAASSEPPGGLEMPPGDVPPPVEEQDSAPKGGIEMPKDVPVPVDSGASVTPAVQYGSWPEIQTTARTSGRITVVDLWSLACEPCLKEFPGLVRLHQTLGSTIQCIAVDLDFDGRKTRPPEYYEDRVVAFLNSVGAEGFPTYISQTPSDDVFAETKLVSIPAVLVYDANGEVVKVFVDAGETQGFTYENDVIPLVKKLAG